jgi:hypothetical protein
MKNTRTSKKPPTAADVLEDLRPGQSVELLQELHILTREGRINQDSRRKLKQVHHLYQFIEKLLLSLGDGVTVADHGAGKSYLGFILYDLFFRARPDGWIYGIETRQELVQKSQALAQRLGFARMTFLPMSVAEATGFDRTAAAHRHGDGAARLRHRHGRCHPLRAAKTCTLHGPGALLPGGTGTPALCQQGAEPGPHPAG